MPALIRDLSPEINQKLEKASARKSFSADQLIFAEGDEATFLPVVLKGSVKMVRYPADGKEVIIGIFRAGEIFAIPPALDGRQFPATAIAMEDAELLFLPRPEFLRMLAESPDFSSVVLSKMGGILRDRSKTLEILAAPSPEQRIGKVLLQIAEEASGKTPVEIKLRRQDIAEMAGLTTETTIRTIKRMSETGLLKIVRRKIYLEDIEALRDSLQ